MSASYYGDLSDASSSSTDSDEEDGEDARNDHGDSDQHRVLLHVDVDCFYCQCEQIDRQIPLDRPFAIGQKHIIVTSNYAARKCGVGKLQSRELAVAKCPNLLILEGSDLERYRQHARRIYEAFRSACRSLNEKIAVRRGSMDEIMADLTPLIDDPSLSFTTDGNDYYVYGEQSDRTILTEDQTGEETIVDATFAKNNLFLGKNETKTAQRLRFAARFALDIRLKILSQTGFTTTMGISTNLLLSKIASGLQKPATVNILFPWHAVSLVFHMPLRKLPGVGSTTMKSLKSCLEENLSTKPTVWTCGDLLSLSPATIASHLQMRSKDRNSSKPWMKEVQRIIANCQGIDEIPLVDDSGGLSKTLSAENSFRRGSLITKSNQWNALQDICDRLVRLLSDRRSWSYQPENAHPATIRLTLRTVDTSMQQRRPFVTRSKQTPIHGMELVGDSSNVSLRLQSAVSPLFHSMVPRDNIDVTRMNIALADFGDLDSPKERTTASLILEKIGPTVDSAQLDLKDTYWSSTAFSKNHPKYPHANPSSRTKMKNSVREEIGKQRKSITASSGAIKKRCHRGVDFYFASKI